MRRNRITAVRVLLPLMAGAVLAPAPASGHTPLPSPADTIPLPELVVTATRVPLPVESLPTPVTVLTGTELRERGIRTVADALHLVSSSAIAQAGAAGAQTSLFLRGGQSGYVKVLVDGVAVNDPGGSMDLADLTTNQVDRIEIVRGPASVLYGSDAVSGVVQIFTRRGSGAPSIVATTTGGRGERRYEDGSYASANADATVSGSAGSLGYMVGGGRSWNEGAYPFNSDRRLDVLNARLDWSGNTEISATARFSDSDTGFPTDFAGNLADRNARLERRSFTSNLEAAHRLGDRAVTRIQLGLLDRSQSSINEPDSPADTLGVYASRLDIDIRRLSADARIDFDLPATIATVGVALQDQRGATSYVSRSQWGPSEADAEFQRGNRGYYVQLISEPRARLNLTAGARLDDNQVFGVFHTYRAGLSYALGSTRLRAAAGRAFREPTFAESFGSGFGEAGNPELVPERSESWEIGLDQRLGTVIGVGATWFAQRFEDMIQFTFAPPDPADPNYFNVGAAIARGLELTAEADLGAVALGASYSLLTTRVLDPGLATDAGFVQGEPLLRRPARAANVSGRYGVGAGVVTTTVRWTGEREDLDFGEGFPAPRVTMPAHTTVDMAAESRLPLRAGPASHVLLRIENLFNARYESIRGFPAPGRLISAGFRIRAGGGS